MTNSVPITLVEAVNQALHYEMAHDPSVVVLGEDIGRNGGAFVRRLVCSINLENNAFAILHSLSQ